MLPIRAKQLVLVLLSCLIIGFKTTALASDKNKLQNWLKYYYSHQDQSQVVPAMDFYFGDRQKPNRTRTWSLIGSFSSLFRQHPAKALDWIKQSSLNRQQRRPLIESLWYAGLNKKAITMASSDKWSAKDRQRLATPSPEIKTMRLHSASQIAMLWGAYRITGDQALLARVITIMLNPEQHSVNTDTDKMSEFAARSLNVYLDQHEQVEQQYLKFIKHINEDERLILEILLSENEVSGDTPECD